MLEELDRVRQQDRRSRSEVMREAFSHYMAITHRIAELPVDDPSPEELAAIATGRAAIARGEFMTLDALLGDLDSHRPA
jgi:predicted transcriptional regulator